MRLRHILSVTAVLTLMAGNALGETSTTICWGEFKTEQECKHQDVNNDCSHTCAMNSYSQHYACPGGGFNPAAACNAVCAKAPGAGCTIKPGPGTDGNKCGYRWATLTCD
ncbi:hypothetical protein ABIF50_005858 [Bradyrhizobium diazoefficiens]